MADAFVYAVVLRLPSGKYADGGKIRRRRRLMDGMLIEFGAERWRVDHVVADEHPPLAYLVPDNTEPLR